MDDNGIMPVEISDDGYAMCMDECVVVMMPLIISNGHTERPISWAFH